MLHRGGRPLRTTGEQADARRARPLPAVPGPRARAAREVRVARRPRRVRLGRGVPDARGAGPRRRPRPTFGHGAEARVGPYALARLVPPEPAEHVHRPPHPADAPTPSSRRPSTPLRARLRAATGGRTWMTSGEFHSADGTERLARPRRRRDGVLPDVVGGRVGAARRRHRRPAGRRRPRPGRRRAIDRRHGPPPHQAGDEDGMSRRAWSSRRRSPRPPELGLVADPTVVQSFGRPGRAGHRGRRCRSGARRWASSPARTAPYGIVDPQGPAARVRSRRCRSHAATAAARSTSRSGCRTSRRRRSGRRGAGGRTVLVGAASDGWLADAAGNETTSPPSRAATRRGRAGAAQAGAAPDQAAHDRVEPTRRRRRRARRPRR